MTPLTPLGVRPQCLLIISLKMKFETDWSNSSQCAPVHDQHVKTPVRVGLRDWLSFYQIHQPLHHPFTPKKFLHQCFMISNLYLLYFKPFDRIIYCWSALQGELSECCCTTLVFSLGCQLYYDAIIALLPPQWAQ